MKELKFRVWDTKNKQFLSQSSEYYHIGDVTGIPYTLNEILNKLDRFVVQQWTGLKDSKGVDVYEGDIIERKTLTKTENHSYNYCHCYEVIYSTDEASYILKYGSGDDFVYLSDFIDNLEIIGNIFENSKLLKQ